MAEENTYKTAIHLPWNSGKQVLQHCALVSSGF